MIPAHKLLPTGPGIESGRLIAPARSKAVSVLALSNGHRQCARLCVWAATPWAARDPGADSALLGRLCCFRLAALLTRYAMIEVEVDRRDHIIDDTSMAITMGTTDPLHEAF